MWIVFSTSFGLRSILFDYNSDSGMFGIQQVHFRCDFKLILLHVLFNIRSSCRPNRAVSLLAFGESVRNTVLCCFTKNDADMR
jgi:hypothetical protein